MLETAPSPVFVHVLHIYLPHIYVCSIVDTRVIGALGMQYLRSSFAVRVVER